MINRDLFPHAACRACPCIYHHLRKAVGLLDDSRDLARVAHILLDHGATHADVTEASKALIRAGVMRVDATTEVRHAWEALQESGVPA